MSEAVDLDGNPRIFNATVDMGAYEFTMTTEPQLLLQGAYDSESNLMTTPLADGGSIPLVCPYAAEVQAASSIPSNTTDWVLLQLLDTNDFSVVAVKGTFLRDDGEVVNEDGQTGIRLECSPGYYYLVAKHRNHCAVMSTGPIAYTNALITYDFTTGPDKFFGGTDACAELASSVWGMIAGDCDGDGKITEVDREIVRQQVGTTGYLPGDCNLDGVVTDDDLP